MSVGELTSRDAVLKAMAEHDELGPDAFLQKYGFGRATNYLLVHDGREYDSKAIVGAAYGYQFPQRGPLKSEEFTGGLGSTVPKLKSLGFEIREIRADRGSDPQDGGQAWLFQSNPRYYDIAAAVRALDEMNWTVAQGKNEVRAGERVYIWQSGSDGGLIAEGTTLTEPAMLPTQEGHEFIVDEEKFAGEQLRVRLSIDRVLATAITRETLLRHPVLKDLTVLRFANATNYKVSPEQDAALQDLIIGAEMTLEDRITQWREETGYPSEKDQEQADRRELLAKALSVMSLDRVIEDPYQFDALEFGKLAHHA